MPMRNATTSLVILCDSTAPALLGQETVNAAGLPVQRYRKAILKVGNYQHPASGAKFDIDVPFLDNAVTQFDRMKANGVAVKLMSKHSAHSDDTRGTVLRLWRDGEFLWQDEEAEGRDAILSAARNDRSIFAEKSFRDGNKNEYPWAIQHVAITPVPVIQGLPSAVAIAASRGMEAVPDKVPVFSFDTTGASTMNPMLMQIAQAMGIPTDGITDDQQILSQILAKCSGSASTDPNAMPAMMAMKNELADTKAKMETIKMELDTTKNSAKPSPILLRLAAENRRLRINAPVFAGKITKEQGEKLAAIFVGGADALALSATLDEPNMVRFDAVMDFVDSLPATREVDLAGGIVASRNVPDADDNKPDPDMDARLARAGVAAKK